MNWLIRIAQQKYYGFDQAYNGLWVDPQGKQYELEYTHQKWIYDNKDLLKREYDIDMDEWYLDRLNEEERELFDRLYSEKIKEKAYELDVDESQVELTDEEVEEIQNYAAESADDGINVSLESVDFLILNGWLRISQKYSVIHVEANPAISGFLRRVENALTKRFPKIWSQTYTIVINDQEISSRDLQEYGNLQSALQEEARRNHLLMYRR